MTGRESAFHFNLHGRPLRVRGRQGAALLGALLSISGCSIDDRETKVASGELTPRDMAQATDGGPAPSALGREAPGELAPLPALGASSANGSANGEVAAATMPACPGCTVNGECLASGALAPNPCLICDPARSRAGWSSNDGASCDDGQFCTVEDTCSNGACGGTPRECDDGIGCNGVSTCDERASACTPAVNLCDPGALCSSDGSCVTSCAGCVIDGNCIAAGAHPAGNSCLVCDPARSTTSYLASAAGTACGDSRSSACDDSDACDGSGACQTRHRADGSACSDGQACTVDDSCRAGLCAPGPLRTCPGGSTCDPSSGNCVCQEGQRRCDGNLLEVCSGGGFDLAEDCGDDRVCNAAAGRCDCQDDSDPNTTLVQHQNLGCGFSRNLGTERWVSFANGVELDPGTGFAWLDLGFFTASAAASACADLNIGGLTGWRLPSIDEVRSLIAGCPATNACPLSDPACLSMSCGQCDSCAGSAGPNAGEYCRPIVPVCTLMHTRSTCRDCADPSFEWIYEPVNGNFLPSDPADLIGGYCFHAGLSL